MSCCHLDGKLSLDVRLTASDVSFFLLDKECIMDFMGSELAVGRPLSQSPKEYSELIFSSLDILFAHSAFLLLDGCMISF